MMLRDEFYQLKAVERFEGGGRIRVQLLPESAIYAAHFKGMPVTPGACLVEMACELAAELFGGSPDVSEASDIRFLKTILPGETTEITFELEGMAAEGPFPCQVRVLDGETLCAKMKLVLVG